MGLNFVTPELGTQRAHDPFWISVLSRFPTVLLSPCPEAGCQGPSATESILRRFPRTEAMFPERGLPWTHVAKQHLASCAHARSLTLTDFRARRLMKLPKLSGSGCEPIVMIKCSARGRPKPWPRPGHSLGPGGASSHTRHLFLFAKASWEVLSTNIASVPGLFCGAA